MQKNSKKVSFTDLPDGKKEPYTPIMGSDEWEQANLTINHRKKYGSGAQGKVLGATFVSPETHENYNCVVKIFNGTQSISVLESLRHVDLTDQEKRSAEIGILRACGECVIKDENGVETHALVLPQCDIILRDCLSAIVSLKTQNIPLYHHVVFGLFHSMVMGLLFLAEKQTLHNDIKPQNIGYHNGWCLLDFGMAQTYEEYENTPDELKGTPYYMPPELFGGEKSWKSAGDIWSLGQTLRKVLNKELAPVKYEHSDVKAFLHDKCIKFREAREQNPIPTKENLEDYQTILKQSFLEENQFDNCINLIVDSMCAMLPENRPTLATLQSCAEHLSSIIGKIDQEEIDEFYNFLIRTTKLTKSASTSSLRVMEKLASDPSQTMSPPRIDRTNNIHQFWKQDHSDKLKNTPSSDNSCSR